MSNAVPIRVAGAPRADFGRVADVLETAITAGAFPGAVILVARGGEVVWHAAFGSRSLEPDRMPMTPDMVFDLSSLTKPLATTRLVLALVAHDRLRLDERAGNLFPEWRGIDRSSVTVTDLLEHASGLPARLVDRPPQGRREFEHDICSMPLEYAPRTTSLYSDLGFILLGFLVADREGRSLDEAFAAHAVRPEERGVMSFGPVEGDGLVAPTEPLDDDPRRGTRLAGQVHDAYAFLLGGVAGHAGLFGNAAGVGAYARVVLQALRGTRHPSPALIPPDLLRRSIRRSEVPSSSRALGWDTMRPTSSCGTRMSAAAFGHVGFTGTSLWIDPPNDRYFVLLTNRACGGGTLEKMWDLRRSFHDALAEVSGP